MKLGLGTAQFGLRYGITNALGQVSRQEVMRILQTGASHGIDLLDTAAAYGESESAIGECVSKGQAFRIVSKVSAVKSLTATVKQSLNRLRQTSLYGLLLHGLEGFTGSEGKHILAELKQFRQSGLAQKIGVSVYTAKELDQTLDHFVPDVIQVPVNVFDQRLLISGHLKKLKEAGVEIHARSIFLQGLLLSSQTLPNPYFAAFRAHLDHYRDALHRRGLQPLELTLKFIRSCPDIDYAIVGVTSHQELSAIIEAWNRVPSRTDDFSDLAVTDERLINPSLWKLSA